MLGNGRHLDGAGTARGLGQCEPLLHRPINEPNIVAVYAAQEFSCKQLPIRGRDLKEIGLAFAKRADEFTFFAVRVGADELIYGNWYKSVLDQVGDLVDSRPAALEALVSALPQRLADHIPYEHRLALGCGQLARLCNRGHPRQAGETPLVFIGLDGAVEAFHYYQPIC
jgi:hypothetical protein